jgi:hypothetical protein
MIKEIPTKYILKVNHIFRISFLLLHVSALYERHLHGAQSILMKLCVEGDPLPVHLYGTYNVAYTVFHQDALGFLKMALLQRRNL